MSILLIYIQDWFINLYKYSSGPFWHQPIVDWCIVWHARKFGLVGASAMWIFFQVHGELGIRPAGRWLQNAITKDIPWSHSFHSTVLDLKEQIFPNLFLFLLFIFHISKQLTSKIVSATYKKNLQSGPSFHYAGGNRPITARTTIFNQTWQWQQIPFSWDRMTDMFCWSYPILVELVIQNNYFILGW